jgi:hypothetical protein
MQRITISIILIVLLMVFPVISARTEERRTLFQEDFNSLDNWKPFYFPKIEKHSTYTIEKNGEMHYLKAESKASASAIVYKESFDVYEYPRVRWRWKVNNVYAKGDARIKEGDDYPLRVYVMLEYDPDKARAFEKIKYGLAKKLYGASPPHSSLSYVWGNKNDSETIVTSPYTDKAVIIFLRKGPEKVGTWQEEDVNILDAYQ